MTIVTSKLEIEFKAEVSTNFYGNVTILCLDIFNFHFLEKKKKTCLKLNATPPYVYEDCARSIKIYTIICWAKAFIQIQEIGRIKKFSLLL